MGVIGRFKFNFDFLPWMFPLICPLISNTSIINDALATIVVVFPMVIGVMLFLPIVHYFDKSSNRRIISTLIATSILFATESLILYQFEYVQMPSDIIIAMIGVSGIVLSSILTDINSCKKETVSTTILFLFSFCILIFILCLFRISLKAINIPANFIIPITLIFLGLIIILSRIFLLPYLTLQTQSKPLKRAIRERNMNV